MKFFICITYLHDYIFCSAVEQQFGYDNIEKLSRNNKILFEINRLIHKYTYTLSTLNHN